MSSNIKIPKICEFCGNEFIAKTTVTRFCNNNCSRKFNRKTKRKPKIEPLTKKTTIDIYSVKQKSYLSIKEAITLLGISERTIFNLIKNQKIESIKIGARRIIKRSNIEKLFE